MTCIQNRQKQRQPTEIFCKKMFLKILQNLQENTCARVSFFNKVAGLRQNKQKTRNTGRLKTSFLKKYRKKM